MATILGPDGKPFSNKPPEIPGSFRFTRPSSRVSEGLEPERLAQILREAEEGDLTRQMELFEEIEEKDSFLSSQLQTRKNAALGLPWEVQPFDDSPTAKRLADEVNAWLTDIDIEGIMLDALDAIAKGVSVIGLAWKYQGEIYHLVEAEWIHPRDLKYDREKKDFLLRTDTGEQPIPYGAAIVHRYRAKSGSPVRAGLLRGLSWLYLFKNYSIKDWVSFLETFGRPMIIGKYDPSDAEGKRALMRAVLSIAAETYGVISRSTEIDIIEAQKQGSSDAYQRMVELCEREMSTAVLGTAMTSFSGEGGSNAMVSTLNDVRIDLLKADVKALAKTIRRDLFIPFVHFNFGNAELAPKYTALVTEPEDQQKAANTVKTLKEAGLRIPASWAYSKFGIPVPQEGEEVLGADPTPLAPGLRQPVRSASRIPRLASGDQASGFLNGQLYVDALEDGFRREGAGVLRDSLGMILDAVGLARDYDELRHLLAERFPGLDPTSFAGLLENALVLADLAGQAAVREDL
jgi:phage gp29-like protein